MKPLQTSEQTKNNLKIKINSTIIELIVLFLEKAQRYNSENES